MPSLDVYSGSVKAAFSTFAMAGGVNIDFDKSFLAQMAVFALLVIILKPLLFDPVLAIFEQRERRTEGAKAEARDMQEQAGTLLRKYERELLRVNQVAATERDRLRSETARLEAEILLEARNVAVKVINDGRLKIDAEVNKIRFDLGRQSERIARDIATRVLGREVGG